MDDFDLNDLRALQSYDDLAEHGYGERDETRRDLEDEDGWRDEPEAGDDDAA
jgi:hypothetical protein